MTIFVRATALVVLGALLSGCAVGSGPSQLTTGSIFSSMPSAASLVPSLPSLPALGSAQPSYERISGNLYRINANDRRIDDPIQRDNYALLRAAEITKELGASHFIAVSTAQSVGKRAEGSSAGSDQSAGMIRVLHIEAGAEAPIGAISADEIVHFFGPSFGRTPPAAAASTDAVPSRG